jgi:hypothetical protein
MAQALLAGGLYKVGGKLVNAEGKEVAAKDLPSKFRSAASTPVASTVESDLPDDFPGRKELIAAGITELSVAKSKSRDELIAIRGIGEKTADEILAAVE